MLPVERNGPPHRKTERKIYSWAPFLSRVVSCLLKSCGGTVRLCCGWKRGLAVGKKGHLPSPSTVEEYLGERGGKKCPEEKGKECLSSLPGGLIKRNFDARYSSSRSYPLQRRGNKQRITRIKPFLLKKKKEKRSRPTLPKGSGGGRGRVQGEKGYGVTSTFSQDEEKVSWKKKGVKFVKWTKKTAYLKKRGYSERKRKLSFS